MTKKFADAARAELAAGISSSATSVTITAGGSLFPVANTGSAAIGPGADWFKLVIQDDAGFEVVYVRTHTSGSTTFSNVLRGQDGTTGRAFTVPSSGGVVPIVALRPLASDAADWEGKESAITAGTTSQFWRGDKSWQDLAGAVRAVVLTGLSTATNAAITATDSILMALGKLQKQITDAVATLTSHTGNTSNPHGTTKSHLGLGNVDNVSASNLRDRSTHTGSQTISTITNLQAILNAMAPLGNPTFTGTVTLPATTGADTQLSRVMLADTGLVYYDATTASTLDYINGSHQRWAPTGTVTLAVSNWPPSGNLGELLIEGVNLGAATITWPTIQWVLSDGTTDTDFGATEVELQEDGTDWVLLWTRNAGTTIYGKVMR